MWARALALATLFVAAFALQATVAPHLQLAGTPPDLILVAVVTLGLLRGAGSGAAGGIAAGLALDLLRGRQLGLFAFGLGAAGGLAGVTAERVYPSRISVRFAVALAATLLDQFLVVGLFTLSRGDPNLFAVGLGPAIRQALYNGLLAVLAYGPANRAARPREAFRP
jgi:rod shape-determining protein MreD